MKAFELAPRQLTLGPVWAPSCQKPALRASWRPSAARLRIGLGKQPFAAFFIVARDRRHGAAFKSKTISLDRALQADHHRLYVVSQPADDFAR
jgi:hypothetical protein